MWRTILCATASYCKECHAGTWYRIYVQLKSNLMAYLGAECHIPYIKACQIEGYTKHMACTNYKSDGVRGTPLSTSSLVVHTLQDLD